MCDPDATLGATLTFLRDERTELLEAFLGGEYSLWIGSGISRERVPGVSELIEELIRRLYARSLDPADPGCPYMEALNQIMMIANHDLDQLDRRAGPEAWPITEIANRLSTDYHRVLDIQVETQPPLDMVWDLLEVPRMFSDPTLLPDAEHTFIALLLAEGVVSKLVTTNWDPLIERAHEALDLREAAELRVVTHPDDLHGLGNRFLLKVHGCAVRASADPDKHRSFLVASRSQITAWDEDENTRPLRERAQTTFRETLCLFVGLSGQDDNLLRLAQRTPQGRMEEYPRLPTKVAFIQRDLRDFQVAILRQVYGQAYDREASQLREQASLPQCAKPLLGALYVETLLAKMGVIAGLAADDCTFPDNLQAAFGTLRAAAERYLCERYDAIAEATARWRALANEVPRWLSRFVALYRRHELPENDSAYVALCPASPRELSQNAHVQDRDLHWLMLACASLVIGHMNGSWRLFREEQDADCQFLLEKADGRLRVFLLDDHRGGPVQLERAGLIDLQSCSGVVLMYPTGSEPRRRRFRSLTRALPGRGESGHPWELWLQDLVSEVTTLDTLMDSLHAELLAAEAA